MQGENYEGGHILKVCSTEDLANKWVMENVINRDQLHRPWLFDKDSCCWTRGCNYINIEEETVD